MNDLTANSWHQMLKGFFNFCVGQGWMQANPIAKLRPPKIQKGSRTGIFTDEQYDRILQAATEYLPANVPAAERAGWTHRTVAF